jgi:hypothetical protein
MKWYKEGSPHPALPVWNFLDETRRHARVQLVCLLAVSMLVLAIFLGCFQSSRDKRTAPALDMARPRGGEMERQAAGTRDLQYWLCVKLVWSWWAAGRSFSGTGVLLCSQSELLFHPPNW